MAERGGKVRSFEDLRVFQDVRKLVARIYALTSRGPISKDYGLVDQMRRAAVSILSNIAEGFERETDSEFARSLYIAKGSCGELWGQALVAHDQRYWADSDYESMVADCRKISSQLFKLIAYLKDSKTTRRGVA